MIRLLFCSLLLLSPALAAQVYDLGEGLTYVRAKQMEPDLIPSTNDTIALDLRQTAAVTPEEASQLRAFITAPGPVRFVLVAAGTPAALSELLESRAPSVLTVGPVGMNPSPDIDVGVSAEEDRRAYVALEEGTPVDTLVRPNVPKPRRDEAALVRNRANGGVEPLEEPAGERAPSLVDAVLQRTLQLHRGLKALGRL